MNMDEKLYNYYLELKSPEAGEWNSSPQCIHTELITRDYIRRTFTVTDGIQVCNIGIGTGDWDDYLGYWLMGKGNITSIDINNEICEIFAYRQQREGHPHPSKVLCKSIFDSDLPKEKFDIVTLLGSAINETGDFKRCLDSCFSLLNTGGYLMFMANLKYSSLDMLEEYLKHTNYQLEQKNLYEAFHEYPFFICKIKK
ncbi:class I SAM-dependent methyltransferase [Paenibacillus sp. LHD-38]|uniref:class I SAM-dependent methyltransferase n=1 Tax=Paenibacillus sp. LHD-38 TaxID=3072143 RepID=UPI00280CC342|nr:class I SAM-dependent methyltransferase [Paenibacillus sp. LHD-38]MDQ8734266.1 class I SAM-dependent methyltransferase [Paenibacillus sp. LHD-38]